MKKIDHIALQVEDTKQAADWYCENFEAVLLYADDTWSFVQFQNIKLAFVTKGQHPPHIAFEVSDFVLKGLMACHSHRYAFHF